MKINLRTRTPQGDGNCCTSRQSHRGERNLRTRTPQGDGNGDRTRRKKPSSSKFKNQNPARGRKPVVLCALYLFLFYLRTRTPQGDGAYLQPPLPERGRGTA